MSAITPERPPRAGVYGWGQSGKASAPYVFRIERVEGAVCYVSCYCWATKDWHATSFLWRFSDGLNALHWWTGKPSGRNARAPGFTPDFTRPRLTLQALRDAIYYGTTPERLARWQDALTNAEHLPGLKDSEGNDA